MELRRIRYFVAVAEELSFRAAARKLHISQPGVSEQIAQLEHEVGTQLLRRNKRGVALTPAGQAFLPEARAALRAADRARLTARAAAGIGARRVSIGFPSYLEHETAETILDVFIAAEPSVFVELVEGSTVRFLDELKRESLDAAFIRPVVKTEGVEVAALGDEPIIFVVARDHPLGSDSGPLGYEDLATSRILVPHREFNPWLHELFTRPFVERRIPVEVVEASDTHQVSSKGFVHHASRGGCVVPVAASFAKTKSSSLTYRACTDTSYRIGVALAWVAPPRDPAIQRLVALAQAATDGSLSLPTTANQISSARHDADPQGLKR